MKTQFVLRRSSRCLCSTLNRFDDARVASAAAKMPIHRDANLHFGRLRRFREEFSSLDDHAVEAVATLNGLLVNEGLLHGVQRGNCTELFLFRVPLWKTFERRHRF